LAAIAGRNIKKYQLQVGQHNLLVLLQDGNVEQTVDSVLKLGYFNSGQGITPKVLIVHKSLAEKLKALLIERLKQMKFGNP